jgi:O-antigen/teichoic acid export membrane protein
MKIAAARSNTKTIASNSFWNGLEMVSSVIATFATSIPMARVIGPERLGYFNYVQWLTNLSGMVGMLGIPGATRKFMAEYLGRGEAEIAVAVYRATLKLQTWIASGVTAVGLAVVLWGAIPQYRWIAFFLVLSLWPSMMASIPSQANVAGERMAFNTYGSLASYVVNIAAVTVSLVMGWDLFGIAVGVFAFRAVDCGLRLIFVHRWLGGTAAGPLPAELKRKMTTFSGYGLALNILYMIVWDRSDMIFLRNLVRDTAQIAFFSVAMGLIEKVLTIPTAFGNAAFATIQAQYGRNRLDMPRVTSHALWYSFAFSVPLLLGIAAISRQLIPFMYGAKYLPAIPVLFIAAVLAVPKSLASPAWSAMEAEFQQRFLLIWLIICAIANMGLDILLIPHMGAVGAAIANGLAQLLLPAGLIWRAHTLFGLDFHLAQVGKLLLSSFVMGAAVMAISLRSHAWWALLGEVAVGAVVFVVCARFTGAFSDEDRERILPLGSRLPARVRFWFQRIVIFLAPVRVKAPLDSVKVA